MAINEEGLHETIMALRCDIHLTQLLLTEVILQLPNPQSPLLRLKEGIERMTEKAAPKNELETECLVRMRARVAQMLQQYQV